MRYYPNCCSRSPGYPDAPLLRMTGVLEAKGSLLDSLGRIIPECLLSLIAESALEARALYAECLFNNQERDPWDASRCRHAGSLNQNSIVSSSLLERERSRARALSLSLGSSVSLFSRYVSIGRQVKRPTNLQPSDRSAFIVLRAAQRGEATKGRRVRFPSDRRNLIPRRV